MCSLFTRIYILLNLCLAVFYFNTYCLALKKNTFFTLCWLYSALYAGALCHGFIRGFIPWLYTMALFWALYWVSCRWAGACPSLPSLPAPSWRPPAPTGRRRRSWEILALYENFIAIEIQFWGWSRGAGAFLGIIQLYFLLYTCFIPGDQLTGGPSTPGELNPLAPGDSIDSALF